MSTPVRSGRAQRLGQVAAVGAVTLVLAGSVVALAAARMRSGAVYAVNNVVDSCFTSGGDATVSEQGTAFTVTCVFSEGRAMTWEHPEAFPPSERAAPQNAPVPAPAAPQSQMVLGDTPPANAPASGVAAEPYVDYTIGAGSESGGNYGFTAATTARATAARGQRPDDGRQSLRS